MENGDKRLETISDKHIVLSKNLRILTNPTI